MLTMPIELDHVCESPEELKDSETLRLVIDRYNAAQLAGGAPQITRDEVFSNHALACELWEFAQKIVTAKLEDGEKITRVVKATLGEILLAEKHDTVASPQEVQKQMPLLLLDESLCWMHGRCVHDVLIGKVHPDVVAALHQLTHQDLALLRDCAKDGVFNALQLHDVFRHGEPSVPQLLERLRKASATKKKFGKKEGAKDGKAAAEMA